MDGAGNCTAVIDAKGRRLAYTYDAANRLVGMQTYTAENPDTPVKSVVFTLDALGNVTGYDDGTTSARYVYDDLSRKVQETIDYGAFSLSYRYSYYANGLKKSYTGPEGETVTYFYDENNRLTSMEVPGQGRISIGEFVWNSPTRMTLPGGSSQTFNYDALMQLTGISAKDPGGNSLMTRGYNYSKTGNITSMQTEHGAYAYQYDAVDF